MILLPKSVKIFVATAPVDLHRSFEGLSNEVRCVLAEDPLSGHVFLFLNRRLLSPTLFHRPRPALRRESTGVISRSA